MARDSGKRGETASGGASISLTAQVKTYTALRRQGEQLRVPAEESSMHAALLTYLAPLPAHCRASLHRVNAPTSLYKPITFNVAHILKSTRVTLKLIWSQFVKDVFAKITDKSSLPTRTLAYPMHDRSNMNVCTSIHGSLVEDISVPPQKPLSQISVLVQSWPITTKASHYSHAPPAAQARYPTPAPSSPRLQAPGVRGRWRGVSRGV